MSVAIDRKTLDRRGPLGAAATAQIFTEARTHNAFLDRPVPDALLGEALDLAKMGPTAANQQPLRVLFLRSREAKERLRPAMAPGNVEKTMAAPVVAIAGYDLEFYEHLPYLMPHMDFKSVFAGNPELAARSAAQSGTLQVGYFILALRAVGLDAGPMGRIRSRQSGGRVLSGRKDQGQCHHQHRLWRRRATVPSQSPAFVPPDGEGPLTGTHKPLPSRQRPNFRR
jgi:3-hydroxypropanoate dehydrogenase